MAARNDFERAIERSTGRSVDELRQMPVDELRKEVEKKRGKRTSVISSFPFIGRGNVLRDRTLSSEQINKLVDEVLR